MDGVIKMQTQERNIDILDTVTTCNELWFMGPTGDQDAVITAESSTTGDELWVHGYDWETRMQSSQQNVIPEKFQFES